MPSTIVQKMTGAISILIRPTNAVPSHLRLVGELGEEEADGDAGQDRDDHGDVEPVGAVPPARRRRFAALRCLRP